MPEFGELRQQLTTARQGKSGAEEAVQRARDRVRKARAESTRFLRIFNPDDPDQAEAKRRLDEAQAKADAELRDAVTRFDRARITETGILDAIAEFTDPVKGIGNLSDRFPLLMLPVRVETRFKRLDQNGQISNELWVRVYPDDCAIDTFEPTLTNDEVRSARRYWAEIWAAGGNETDERAAWRSLVASHGSGRATWIVRNFRPSNPGDRPARAAATDVLLVVAGVPAAERDVVGTFWQAMWISDRKRADVEAARAVLVGVVGEERAAQIERDTRPAGFNQVPKPPSKRNEVTVRVAFIDFPDNVETKEQSWTRAPKVSVLPDRFVLIGIRDGVVDIRHIGRPIPSPLVAGPDPYAPPEEQLHEENGRMVVPENMRWMFDFNAAVENGMGFRVPLTVDQAIRGFDRLFVVGVRLSLDEERAQEQLETLLLNHHFGRSGFALLRQGAPTNNTESTGSGFSRAEEADESFASREAEGDDSVERGDWLRKTDGQWFAEYLGIRREILNGIPGTTDTDQSVARAMNTALWPATFGYWMETMMHPVFTPEAVERTRAFFTRHVSGRGSIPAIRIGKQPYGILPATPFRRLRWMNAQPDIVRPAKTGELRFLARLYPVLLNMDSDWQQMAAQVSFTGKAGDAHRILLDILGLHSGSVEYAQRYAQSLDDLFNQLNVGGFGGALIAALVTAGIVQSGRDHLNRFGYSGEETPDLMNRFFYGSHIDLRGPVIDDRPLSETEEIRSYTADNLNYLRWLIDAARTSLERVRREEGFSPAAPRALLYILLRYAIEQGYYDTGLRFSEEFGILTEGAVRQARREAPFIHVEAQEASSESRYQLLYSAAERVTGDPRTLLADHITATIGRASATRHLFGQLSAIEVLEHEPTASLERAFAEHIDCCSYRLDAWMLGLVQYQLTNMRAIREDDQNESVKGIYLGAYAMLEDVRAENKQVSPVDLPEDLQADFGSPDEAPLLRDSNNGGYIHAPSLNHAVTAAVLRNGYITSASPENRQSLSVNLTSHRVRTALGIIEGMREGQSLGALLGYRFERGLHDSHGLAEVDEFIYDLRKAFPLRADRLAATKTEAGVSIEAIEARNVMDGLRFVEQMRASGETTYPFGKTLPDATDAQKLAMNIEAANLIEIHDALADLAMAEGVHQAVQGNFDRVAGTLDAFSKGTYLPEPAVVRTPDSGHGLTHRVALHLDSSSDPTVSPVAGLNMTPRAIADPALNKWLSKMLPPLGQIGCAVSYFDAAANAPAEREVRLSELALQPIDLLFAVDAAQPEAIAELDERVTTAVASAVSVRPDHPVSIRYMDRGGAELSVFEAMPLLRNLRTIALTSRPLRPTDLASANEASEAADELVTADPRRVALGHAALTTLRGDIETLVTDISTPLDDPAREDEVIDEADAFVARLAAVFARASSFGIPQTSVAFAYDWQRRIFAAILAKLAETAARWQARLTQFDLDLTAYDTLPATTTPEERMAVLRRIEALVAVVPEPAPIDPDALRLALPAKRNALDSKRQQVAAFAASGSTGVSQLLAEVEASLPFTAFDAADLNLIDERRQTLAFARDTVGALRGLVQAIQTRLDVTNARLTEHDEAATPMQRVKALEAGAKALLGEATVFVPEFTLDAERSAEAERALAHSAGGSLFTYLQDTAKVPLPVDEWMYGVARVREKMRAWEQMVMFSAAFGATEASLTAMQFPHSDENQWFALDVPPGTAFDKEHLLYTAHFDVPFETAGTHCGLLLDEWNEAIPTGEVNTGLAFNYDRPNTEAPQAMLLLTPAAFTGQWQWDDVVDALNETLDMAKKRAVEPVHLESTPYARFLPATIMATTWHPLTIVANLAYNNPLFAAQR